MRLAEIYFLLIYHLLLGLREKRIFGMKMIKLYWIELPKDLFRQLCL